MKEEEEEEEEEQEKRENVGGGEEINMVAQFIRRKQLTFGESFLFQNFYRTTVKVQYRRENVSFDLEPEIFKLWFSPIGGCTWQ